MILFHHLDIIDFLFCSRSTFDQSDVFLNCIFWISLNLNYIF